MDLFKKTHKNPSPARKNPPLRQHVRQEPPEVILREMIEQHGLVDLLEALAQEVMAAGEEQGLSEEDAEEASVALSELAEFCSGPSEDDEEESDEDEDEDEDESEDDDVEDEPEPEED